MSECTTIGRLNLGCRRLAPTGADVLIRTNEIGCARAEIVSFCNALLQIDNMIYTCRCVSVARHIPICRRAMHNEDMYIRRTLVIA